MLRIDFTEIEDWEVFEDLTADYFRVIPFLKDNDLKEVRVDPTGVGPDGGRDILLTFRIDDSICSFERKWVVQCKFYDKMSKSDLDKINIPTLINEYGADGYLLICKNTVNAGVTNTFEKLRLNCRYGYKYEFWNGNHFKHRLYNAEKLHGQYFPKFYAYRNSKLESKLEEIEKLEIQFNVEQIIKK